MKNLLKWSMTFIISFTLLTGPVKAAAQLPTVISESAILMDGVTGDILYEKNIHDAKAPASITKLMTALLAIENLSPEEDLVFSRNAVLSIESGSSHIGMREDEIITVNDGLHGLLLMSANEVANALAETVSGSTGAFADLMNQRARELGARNTNFTNAHGLYEEAHVTSAYDMALITKELLKSDWFLEIMSHTSYQIPPTNITDETRYLHQTHKLLNPLRDPDLYREDTIAGKPGYTVASGHTLVTVSQRDDRILIAVSIKTDAAHLYSDTNALLDYGFNEFDTYVIEPSDYTLPMIIEQDDTAIGQAKVTLEEAITLNLPEGTLASSLVYENNLPMTLDSDVVENQKVGQLYISNEGSQMGPWDLFISEIELSPSVEEAAVFADVEEPSSNKEGPTLISKIIRTILIVLAVGLLLFGLLAYMDMRRRRSYLAYKRKRDAERDRLASPYDK